MRRLQCTALTLSLGARCILMSASEASCTQHAKGASGSQQLYCACCPNLQQLILLMLFAIEGWQQAVTLSFISSISVQVCGILEARGRMQHFHHYKNDETTSSACPPSWYDSQFEISRPSQNSQEGCKAQPSQEA